METPMLSQCKLIGFIPTTDGERARKFYVDVLNLQFVADDQFALVVKANENTIRIVRMEKFSPVPYTILGWEVEDIHSAVRELAAAGVAFVRYPYFQQDDSGVWASPSGAKVAWFHDPDGNVLSISQH
jgi:catechol 2,3-dioxygenase-like lactoylglutathione lyase family enzyme